MRRACGAILLALVVLVAAARAEAGRASTPEALERVGFDQRLGESVEMDLAFTDESGKEVRLARYFSGRPIVLTLVYYECPMLCSLVMDSVVRALQRLPFDAGEDYEWVVVSFAPAETPAMARTTKRTLAARYAHGGAETGWHFLVGGEPAIRSLAGDVGFRYAYDEETQQYAHPAGIVVLTGEGRVGKYFFGTEFDPDDLRLGLVDASGGAIGTLADEVLLRCYHYDPATGRYTLAIMSVVRIAGAITAALLVGLVLWLLRRERVRAQEGAGP